MGEVVGRSNFSCMHRYNDQHFEPSCVYKYQGVARQNFVSHCIDAIQVARDDSEKLCPRSAECEPSFGRRDRSQAAIMLSVHAKQHEAKLYGSWYGRMLIPGL
jgi:hypothetical protein